MLHCADDPHYLPYTTLFRSKHGTHLRGVIGRQLNGFAIGQRLDVDLPAAVEGAGPANERQQTAVARQRRLRGGICEVSQDRKSTRLNSSHLGSSYAVFCLKK